ncbi:MAG: VWA domain-containing protein [Anaerolineae bacterium]
MLIVVTDGRIESGGAARAVADAAKATGIVVVTAGIGPELNRPLLVAIASSPDHASFSADEAALLLDVWPASRAAEVRADGVLERAGAVA